MEETRSDAELLARASRQPELFGIVFDRHFATIHCYLERRVGRDGADELSGEVFRIGFEQRRRFRPVHESALPWLYGLATNLMLRRWRGNAREARALRRLEVASRNGDAGGLVAVWLRGDYTVEARGLAPDADAFRAMLAALDEVDVDTWLSAMPASVVQPAMQAEVIDEMLAGIPLPPGFDSTAIPITEAVRDRYQLGAQVAGAVACAWIDRWVAARDAGDDAGAREAVDAMATSPTWPVLLEMEAEGAYPEVLREYAAAMAGNGLVPAGKPLTVEETYESALGCPGP